MREGREEPSVLGYLFSDSSMLGCTGSPESEWDRGCNDMTSSRRGLSVDRNVVRMVYCRVLQVSRSRYSTTSDNRLGTSATGLEGDKGYSRIELDPW